MTSSADNEKEKAVQVAAKHEPLPRPLFWVCLVGFLLALLLSGWTGYACRQSRLEFRQMVQDHVLADQEGASFFRLRVDKNNQLQYSWQPLFISPLKMPDGPLPGQEDYKVKAVATFNLEKAQRLYFRIKGNDGISVLLQGERIFDEWRPVHLGILSDFTEVAGAGLNVLVLDYYLGHNKGTLELRVLDALGQEIKLQPLRLALDGYRWQELLARRHLTKQLAGLGLVLAAVLALLPLVWMSLRNPTWLPERLRLARPLLPGFWCGFWPVMLYQMGTYVGIADDQDVQHLIVAPLLGGVTAALVQGLLLGWCPGRPRKLAMWLKPRREWYLAHEDWLTPLLLFAGLFLFLSWVVDVRGGDFPHTWLKAPWDVIHYKDIMVRGLVLERLEWGGMLGNYAWHPFFPLLARIPHFLGLHPDWAMVATAWLASAFAFLLVFRLARVLFSLSAARWSVLAMAAYPCSFYLLIGYPYGTAIALIAGYCLAVHAGRYWLAFILGCGLGMTSPTGVLAGIVPIFLVGERLRHEPNPWPAVRDMVVAGAGPAVGLFGLCAWHWWRFGDFLQPISGHGNWGRAAAWPWDVIMDGILHEPPQYPEAIATLAVLLAMIIFAHRFLPALWALLILIFILGPSTGSLESTYRQYLMAWPVFILIGSSPRSRWIKGAVLWLFLYFAMTWYLPLWLVRDLV
jgi:hypothetical protein